MSLLRSVVLVLAVVLAPLVLSAQPRLDGSLMMTAEQIIAVAGSEQDAADLVQQALRQFLPDQARTDGNTVFVVSPQLRADWLPDLPHVRWTRLADQDAAAYSNQCGRLLFIRSIQPWPNAGRR